MATAPTRPACPAGAATNSHPCRPRFEATGEPPACEACGGIVKSATISFGQAMPEAADAAGAGTRLACDLFLAIGSSLVVYPAAAFPALAKRNGARLVIVNREPTELDEMADLVIHGEIGRVLGSLCVTRDRTTAAKFAHRESDRAFGLPRIHERCYLPVKNRVALIRLRVPSCLTITVPVPFDDAKGTRSRLERSRHDASDRICGQSVRSISSRSAAASSGSTSLRVSASSCPITACPMFSCT